MFVIDELSVAHVAHVDNWEVILACRWENMVLTVSDRQHNIS
jgi:hypothetical protein